jgi:hypothetical protein
MQRQAVVRGHGTTAALDGELGFLYIGRLSVQSNAEYGFAWSPVRTTRGSGDFMIWYRRMMAGLMVAGMGSAFGVVGAQDAEPKKAAPAPVAEAPKKKDPFFGDRFAMYLETRGGPASIDAFEAPTSNGADISTDSSLELTDNKSGQFTIGWTLPRGRGQYLLTYTGIADGNYELDATGYERAFIGSQGTPADQLPWWHLSVQDGVLHTTKVPPVWDSATDDADHDSFPDRNEIRFPTTTANLSNAVPDDLGNRISTWDLLYRREFGGVKIRAAWTAGIRYLDYEGAMPVPAWLIGTNLISGFGFSDGVMNKMLLMQQKTTGWGPTGSGEIDFHFFRQRLTLYGVLRAAFLLQSLETDSGSFTSLTFEDSSGASVIPGQGHLSQQVDKTGWNTTLEAGVKVKLMEGFHLIVDYNATGYLDTVLLPQTLSFPANSSQIALGTVATYVSRDTVVSSVNIGLSFQF